MASSTGEPIQVAFENEYVRIVHVSLAAGQKPPKYTPAATPIVTVDLNSGNVQYSDSVSPDDAKRPNNAAVREIRVELKGAPETKPLALDAVRIEPTRFKVVFENERARVVHLHFGPRERGVMVSHPPRVLVTLTDVSVKLLFADGRTDERGAPAGVAAWLDTETLQTENARNEPLEVVLVEPKSARGF
jgi:beta-alanine degradation protein BauB